MAKLGNIGEAMHSLCMNVFGNMLPLFSDVLIVILKLQANVPYTNNANCINGKEMSSQTSERQMPERPNKTQTNPKDNDFNLRILQKFRFIQFVFHCQKFRICKTASKKNLKNGLSLEYGEFGHFTLLFCKNRQRNEQRLTTHAYRQSLLIN